MEEKGQEFSLEDILKEFGEEEIQASPAPPAEPETPPVPGATEDTIRLDTTAFARGAVHNAQPLEETQEIPAEPEIVLEAPQQTPFEGQWEPEYEQPIGEYVPPQPIIFHPRSRLRELKKKLVEGPERRYYELSEKGVGKLQVAIFLSLLVALIAAGSTVLYALDTVPQERLRLMVFGQFLAMLLSVLLGYNQMISGVTDLFKGRYTLNTMLVVTFAACCLDGIGCLRQLRIPCCAAFSLEMTMSLWATYQKRNTELMQMDTLRKAVSLDRWMVSEPAEELGKCIAKGEGQVEDFMDTYSHRPKPEKQQSVYSLFATLAAVGIGITAGILHGVDVGIQVTAVSLLTAVPAAAFVVYSRPAAILARRLQEMGTLICGWQGVEGLRGKLALPLAHEDLFPQGTVKLNGLKFFGSRDPDQVVAYAAALVTADGGGLTPLFEQLLDGRNGRHYTAQNFRVYGNGGIGAEVCGEPVLVGPLAFLKEMGVEIPASLKMSQAVCVAVDGQLSGLFAVVHTRSRGVAVGLSAVCACRGVQPLISGADFILTPSFLRNKFGIKPKKLFFTQRQQWQQLQEQTQQLEAAALLLTTREGIAPVAVGVVGARALHAACGAGTVIYMLGGIVGLVVMLLLTLLGAVELISPSNMFLYQLLWLIPGLLVTQWTRVI